MVRRATPADVEGCLDVLEEVVAEGVWLGTEALNRPERAARILEAVEGERSTHLVAVTDSGQVVGHLGLDVAPYGVAQFGMCVAPAWRGQGVGGRLVEGAIASARELGAHKLTLQVWPHNAAARRLYRRHGFVEEGRLRRHYPRRNGELWDAIVMALFLDVDTPGSSLPDAPEDDRG